MPFNVWDGTHFHFSVPITLTIAGIWAAYALIFILPDRLQANLPHFMTINIPEIFSGLAEMEWLSIAKSLGGLAAIFSSAAIGGTQIIRRLHIAALSIGEQWLFGLGLGLGTFSLSSLAAGLSHALSPVLLLVGVAAFGSFGLIDLFFLSPNHAETSTRYEMDVTRIFAIGLFIFLVILNLIGALGPPIFYDSLVYHLALPKLYLVQGGIFATPENIYSGIPANTEMLYLLGLGISGEGTAKLIPWAISVALAAAIFLWVRRYSEPRISIFAALLFYSCPMVAFQTWASLVELTWALYAFLAFYCLSIVADDRHSQIYLAVVGGIFAGLAAGVKYNALPLIFIVPLARLLWQQNQGIADKPRAIRHSILFISTAITVVSPWFFKNIWLYQNPFFPLLDGFFGKSFGADWRALLIDAQARPLRNFISIEGLADTLTVLWSFSWENTGMHMVGPAFLLLLPLPLLVKWRNPAYRSLAIFAGLSYLSWSISSRLPRFVLFAAPAAAILSAWTTLSFERGRLSARLLEATLLFACILNAIQITCYWHQWGAWRVVLGQQARSTYLLHGRPGYFTPYYAASNFTNLNLPRSAKILLFGESRSYFFDHEVVATSFFGRDPLVTAVNNAKAADEIRDFLRRDGITHFVVSRAELLRRGTSSPFKNGAGKLFSNFAEKHLRLISKHVVSSPPDDRQWVEVYEVL